jgi:hypothetical protein
VTGEQAQQHANNGRVAIASWKNPTGGHGHIAPLRPGENDSKQDPTIANAGSKNFQKGQVKDSFDKRTPRYWIHD